MGPKGGAKNIGYHEGSIVGEWKRMLAVCTPAGWTRIIRVIYSFYYLSVTHTERGRVGLLGQYRLGALTMDIEPCFSTEGITWQRPHRKPWITRDVRGTTIARAIMLATCESFWK